MKQNQGISYRSFKRYISRRGISLSESQMSIAAHILDLNLSTPELIDDTLVNSVREFIVDKHEHLDTLMGYGKKIDEMDRVPGRLILTGIYGEELESRLAEIGYNSPEMQEMRHLYYEG